MTHFYNDRGVAGTARRANTGTNQKEENLNVLTSCRAQIDAARAEVRSGDEGAIHAGKPLAQHAPGMRGGKISSRPAYRQIVRSS
jgi:hypothetical protein